MSSLLSKATCPSSSITTCQELVSGSKDMSPSTRLRMALRIGIFTTNLWGPLPLSKPAFPTPKHPCSTMSLPTFTFDPRGKATAMFAVCRSLATLFQVGPSAQMRGARSGNSPHCSCGNRRLRGSKS